MMPAPITIVGCDPGFARFGVVVVELHRNDAGEFDDYVVEASVVRTEKDARKKKVLATDDNFRRCQELYAALAPIFARADVIAAEGISHARNAGAMTKVGMAWGVMAALAASGSTPVVQATPQLIKKTMCGISNASKEAVQEAVEARYGDLSELLGSVPRKQRDHAYDAAGAVVCALSSNEVLALQKSKVLEDDNGH